MTKPDPRKPTRIVLSPAASAAFTRALIAAIRDLEAQQEAKEAQEATR